MNDQLKYYIFYSLIYGVILAVAEGMYRYGNMSPARSRNISHLLAGTVSLAFPWLFSSVWIVLLIAVQSSLVLTITKYFKLIPSHHKSAEKSAGSILFFVSLLLCFTVAYYTGERSFFVLPILILTFSDVSAAVIGQNFGKRAWTLFQRKGIRPKTYIGSLAFFFTAWIIVFLFYYFHFEGSLIHSFLMASLVSLTVTLVEAISPFGSDNFFIPAISLIILYISV